MLLSLKSIVLFSLAMMLDTLGNILFKKGSSNFEASTLSGLQGHWSNIRHALACKEIILGVLIAAIEVVVWLAFLSITPLNIAAPLSSINNVFILLASVWFLKEHVSPKRWLGVALIMAGIVFVGGN